MEEVFVGDDGTEWLIMPGAVAGGSTSFHRGAPACTQPLSGRFGRTGETIRRADHAIWSRSDRATDGKERRCVADRSTTRAHNAPPLSNRAQCSML